jgi:hypothetical protein
MSSKGCLLGWLRESHALKDRGLGRGRGGARRAATLMCAIGLALSGGPALSQSAPVTIYLPQGGKIVYGKVEGADSQSAAMMTILRSLHQSFGDKPQIGKVFRMRGTDSVGVYFSAVDRPEGNMPVAGLIIAANSKSHQAQAALVWDRADRLSQSFNPMLEKLFSVWHPGGVEEGTGAAAGTGTSQTAAPAARSPVRAPAAASGRMHRVTTQDRTASAEIPEDWTLQPASGEGAMIITGPNGEFIGMGMKLFATDPSNPNQAGKPRMPGMLYYPYRGDIVASYPDLVQAWRHALGLPSLKLEAVQLKRPPPLPGGQATCVSALGQMDRDGKGMRHYGDLMCASMPGPWGVYMVTLDRTVVPLELAEPEDKVLRAIHDTWKVDFALVKQHSDAAAEQMRVNTENLIAINRRRAHDIQQFGEATQAHFRDVQHQHDVQNRGFEQGQQDISRRGQGFSNYLLDQTVIHDVQDPDTHVTAWNRTAESLIKAYPDRIEEVPTSQYIKGQDF